MHTRVYQHCWFNKSIVCCIWRKTQKRAMHAAIVRVPCARAWRGQAQAAAPQHKNSAKLPCTKVPLDTKALKPATSRFIVWNALRSTLGSRWSKENWVVFSSFEEDNEDWKGPVLISHWYHYTSRLLRETRWCVFFLDEKKPPRLTPQHEFPWATLCGLF